MLGKDLQSVFPNLKTQNKAVSGSNSFDHLMQINTITPRNADVRGIIVITTGGNDIIHQYGRKPPEEGAMYGATLEQADQWLNNFRLRLDNMVSVLKSKFAGSCDIFIANIYDPTDGTGAANSYLTGLPKWPDGLAILHKYNKIIADCADKYDYVHLVNIHDIFLGHGLHCKKFWNKNYRFKDPNYWYYLNIEDPSVRGCDAIRRQFLTEIINCFCKQDNDL